MAMEKLPLLLAALALGTTTLSASRESRSINEATKNTFRCKFNKTIFWFALNVDARPFWSVFSSFRFDAKLYIEEIRAIFVTTGFSKKSKRAIIICKLDVSASTFFFSSYAIQVSGK